MPQGIVKNSGVYDCGFELSDIDVINCSSCIVVLHFILGVVMEESDIGLPTEQAGCIRFRKGGDDLSGR